MAYQCQTFVHTDRKGEAAQVSVSYHRANKPREVLSDAIRLLHKQAQTLTHRTVEYIHWQTSWGMYLYS